MRIKSLLFWVLFSVINSCAYAVAPIKHWQSSQGGQVYFVASTGLPMVDVRFVFDAGSARDGKQFGIASLTASLLETGAGQWNADQLAQRFDEVGAKFSYQVGRDRSSLSLRSLTQKDLFVQAVNTFQQVVGQASFTQQNFQRLKEQVLISLQQQQEKPGYVAKQSFYQSLYGDHPYAHLKQGNLESVKAITLAEVKQFYQQYYVANNAVLVIVGDLTEVQAKKLGDDLYQSLAKGKKADKLPAVDLNLKTKQQHIDFLSTQSHILAGLPVISRQDPDYFPLYVGNHILGGSGLVSKLFGEIREKRGLAYSAYSYLLPLSQAGAFTMGLQTRNEQRSVAINVLLKTLNDFIDKGPSEAELIAAKKNLTGGFVLRFDNNKKLLNYIAMIAFYQLPLNYLDVFQAKVEQVSSAEIKSAFQRRIKMDALQIISVGGQ